MSGAANAKEAADAIRLGAYDYLEKPPTAERLRITLKRCLEHAQLRQSYLRLVSATNRQENLLGTSKGMMQVKKHIAQLAAKDVKVLITGETGTGKEEVAQALWRASSRRGQACITVNCASIPETLIESELFGHVRGAFTGATQNQIGKIEMADRGTLFLDEVGELTLAAQSKLLRFLENGEIQPVGANRTKICDVRLIVATSRDLEGETAKGRFREDLYYRLNVGRIEVPPLRSRREDVVPIFRHFVSTFCRRHNEPDKDIADDALRTLTQHDWPGNVRELRNVAERVAIIAGEQIASGDLALRESPGSALGEAIVPWKEFKQRSEAHYIAGVLQVTSGSVAKAAELLKLDRSHLHQKIAQLGLRPSRD
jgi:two-component system nitrogen regulation response regulator NtrX